MDAYKFRIYPTGSDLQILQTASINFICNFPLSCKLWTVCRCIVILEYKQLIPETFCINWPQICIQNLRMFSGVNITINWHQSYYTFIVYAVPKCSRYSWTTSDFAQTVRPCRRPSSSRYIFDSLPTTSSLKTGNIYPTYSDVFSDVGVSKIVTN